MGNYGIKISEEGQNVFTADFDTTAFSSSNASLMLIDTQTLQLTFPEGESLGGGDTTYSHNLGYFPLVLGYGQDDFTGSTNPLSYFIAFDMDANTRVWAWSVMDIGVNDITVYLSAIAFDPDSMASAPISEDIVFTYNLSIYGFELGTVT